MIEKGFYYQWLDEFRIKLQIHIDKINKILHKHLKDIAEWNPNNVNHTINLTFKHDVDFHKLLSISPYNLIVNKLRNSNSLIIHSLTLSVTEFEDLIILIKNNI